MRILPLIPVQPLNSLPPPTFPRRTSFNYVVDDNHAVAFGFENRFVCHPFSKYNVSAIG
jgi:hypothetical protein